VLPSFSPRGTTPIRRSVFSRNQKCRETRAFRLRLPSPVFRQEGHLIAVLRGQVSRNHVSRIAERAEERRERSHTKVRKHLYIRERHDAPPATVQTLAHAEVYARQIRMTKAYRP